MVAVVVLGSFLGIAVVLWTCEACAREAAEHERDEARGRVALLERTAAIRKRWLGALRDLVG